MQRSRLVKKDSRQSKTDIITIEIAPKSKYEKLLKRVEEFEDLVKEMKFNDIQLKQFIFQYLKPRHKPRLSKDGDELWSQDGRHYSILDTNTLEPTNAKHFFNGKKLAKNEFPYRKPLDIKRKYKLERLKQKLTGKESPLIFSDSAEEKEFDKIAGLMQ